MDIQLSEKQVLEWAKENFKSLGFKCSNIEVNYIWNPGGFVNQSYRLSDGDIARHVKIANEQKVPHLEQWAFISEHLAAHYNAPRLIQEVRHEIVPGYPYGLVFEFLDGKPASTFSDPSEVIQKVMKTLNRLHKDNVIRNAVANKNVHTYSDAFAEVYISRFEEDLQVIRSENQLLDFVSDAAINWFESEVGYLRELARRNPSFEKQATDVVHNDINWQNILMNGNNDYWIIDWDDLTGSGDAAMDYSVLLWPMYKSRKWTSLKEKMIDLAGQETFDRMELYYRAKLFDDVIDVLADYIEAEKIPDVKKKTQKRAREIHLRAYAEYLKHYVKE